jgi:hypothetical protein
MPPRTPEWEHTPSSETEDIQETASEISDGPFDGGPIQHRASPATTASKSTSSLSKDAGSEMAKGSKRRRQDRELKETTEPDEREPEQMIERWYKDHPDYTPDPAVERKAYASNRGRPVKVMDLAGRTLDVQFCYLLVYRLKEVEDQDHGVWVLKENNGRRRIVKRRRLGEKMLLTDTSSGQGDQTADAGFFVWLGEGKFSKTPAGYIINESLDFEPLSPEQMNEIPVLFAFTSSSVPERSTEIGGSARDRASKKSKRDEKENSPVNVRRSGRDKSEPTTYRVTANSFPRYADESTGKARRASNTATTSPPTNPKSKSRKTSSPRRSHRQSTSQVFENSISPPSPPPKKTAVQKSKGIPANVRFAFLLTGLEGARYRQVSVCNDVGKFFAEVHKAAMISGQQEKPKIAMCKFSWLPEQKEQAMLEGDEDDFDDVMKTIKDAPADQDCSVEVTYRVAGGASMDLF